MITSTAKNQIKQITTSLTKKLVALGMLATLAITIAACVNKKPEAQKARTQLENLGIDASKAFFVTATGTKDKNCTTWQNACDLQSAIDKAEKDLTKKFVLVAEGSYYADPNKTDITKTFILKDGVKIYGGFDVNAKKLTRYKDASILEGELKAKEGANAAIHSKQILTGTSLSATSILDGFLIQNALNTDNGNSTDYPKNYIKGAALFLNNSKPQLNNLTFNNNKLTGNRSAGAAIFNHNNSSPSISNTTFSNNSAKDDGGAIYNYKSSPSISNSSFSNNSAEHSGGAIYNYNNSSPSISNATFSKNSANKLGGAIFNNNKSNPSISNSTFSNNSAKYYGGAIYNSDSSPSISNATFSNNSAKGYGGVIYNWSSSPSISNASFSNNSAEYGGAIYNVNDSNPNISNATFSENSASWGGAIYNYDKSNPKIYNSILWNNKDKHKGTEAINNIYNYDGASQPIVKNSILNANSAVTKKGDHTQTDYSKTDPYDFMASDTKFKDNQTPATFSIDAGGKVASANQGFIKDKGDNVLYLEVYDKIKSNPANTSTKIPSDDKDLAGNPRLKGNKIDIGAYEIQN